MLNIGMLDRYCEVMLRNEVINTDGSVSVEAGDESTSKGFIYLKMLSPSSAKTIIVQGDSDTYKQRWLGRWGDVDFLDINPDNYIKFRNQYYHIIGLNDAPEYGRDRAVYIETEIMNKERITNE